jgi:hypothetical protein
MGSECFLHFPLWQFSFSLFAKIDYIVSKRYHLSQLLWIQYIYHICPARTVFSTYVTESSVYASINGIIVPQYINITTKFSTLKLLFFFFSSCLTIERSIVFKTMDRQCESFSRIFSSATGSDKSFMLIRNPRTSSSINENSEIFTKFQNFIISKKIKMFIRLVVTM